MLLMSLPFLLSPGSSPLLDLVPPWQSGGKDGLCGSLGIFCGPGRGMMMNQGYLVDFAQIKGVGFWMPSVRLT